MYLINFKCTWIILIIIPERFTFKVFDTFITEKIKNWQCTIHHYHEKITNVEIGLFNFKLGKLFFNFLQFVILFAIAILFIYLRRTLYQKS